MEIVFVLNTLLTSFILTYGLPVPNYSEFKNTQEYDTFFKNINNIKIQLKAYKCADYLKFNYWNRLSSHKIKFNHESYLKNKWIENMPLKIIIQGWVNTTELEGLNTSTIVQTYTSLNQYNVITVDWISKKITINNVVENCSEMGIILGYFIINLMKLEFVNPSQIHIIGHNISTHIAGQCGRMIFSLTGKKIGRITGLDPFYTKFENVDTSCKCNVELEKNDAQFVDIIHTARDSKEKPKAIGHADFYPNNGKSPQPGCERRILINSVRCSHSRSIKYYLESIKTEKSFESLECSSMKKFKNGECNQNNRNYMGHNADPTVHGTFLLKTNNESPYSFYS